MYQDQDPQESQGYGNQVWYTSQEDQVVDLSQPTQQYILEQYGQGNGQMEIDQQYHGQYEYQEQYYEDPNPNPIDLSRKQYEVSPGTPATVVNVNEGVQFYEYVNDASQSQHSQPQQQTYQFYSQEETPNYSMVYDTDPNVLVVNAYPPYPYPADTRLNFPNATPGTCRMITPQHTISIAPKPMEKTQEAQSHVTGLVEIRDIQFKNCGMGENVTSGGKVKKPRKKNPDAVPAPRREKKVESNSIDNPKKAPKRSKKVNMTSQNFGGNVESGANNLMVKQEEVQELNEQRPFDASNQLVLPSWESTRFPSMIYPQKIRATVSKPMEKTQEAQSHVTGLVEIRDIQFQKHKINANVTSGENVKQPSKPRKKNPDAVPAPKRKKKAESNSINDNPKKAPKRSKKVNMTSLNFGGHVESGANNLMVKQEAVQELNEQRPFDANQLVHQSWQSTQLLLPDTTIKPYTIHNNEIPPVEIPPRIPIEMFQNVVANPGVEVSHLNMVPLQDTQLDKDSIQEMIHQIDKDYEAGHQPLENGMLVLPEIESRSFVQTNETMVLPSVFVRLPDTPPRPVTSSPMMTNRKPVEQSPSRSEKIETKSENLWVNAEAEVSHLDWSSMQRTQLHEQPPFWTNQTPVQTVHQTSESEMLDVSTMQRTQLYQQLPFNHSNQTVHETSESRMLDVSTIRNTQPYEQIPFDHLNKTVHETSESRMLDVSTMQRTQLLEQLPFYHSNQSNNQTVHETSESTMLDVSTMQRTQLLEPLPLFTNKTQQESIKTVHQNSESEMLVLPGIDITSSDAQPNETTDASVSSSVSGGISTTLPGTPSLGIASNAAKNSKKTYLGKRKAPSKQQNTLTAIAKSLISETQKSPIELFTTTKTGKVVDEIMKVKSIPNPLGIEYSGATPVPRKMGRPKLIVNNKERVLKKKFQQIQTGEHKENRKLTRVKTDDSGVFGDTRVRKWFPNKDEQEQLYKHQSFLLESNKAGRPVLESTLWRVIDEDGKFFLHKYEPVDLSGREFHRATTTYLVINRGKELYSRFQPLYHLDIIDTDKVKVAQYLNVDRVTPQLLAIRKTQHLFPHHLIVVDMIFREIITPGGFIKAKIDDGASPEDLEHYKVPWDIIEGEVTERAKSLAAEARLASGIFCPFREFPMVRFCKVVTKAEKKVNCMACAPRSRVAQFHAQFLKQPYDPCTFEPLDDFTPAPTGAYLCSSCLPYMKTMYRLLQHKWLIYACIRGYVTDLVSELSPNEKLDPMSTINSLLEDYEWIIRSFVEFQVVLAEADKDIAKLRKESSRHHHRE